MKESRLLEFKQEITKSYLKTVSAFANYGTGEILFGVTDDGIPSGISDTAKTCLSIENQINDSIKPMPRYTLETRFFNDKEVIVLKVYEGRDKPYLYDGKAYRRNDTSDVEVDRTSLNRLVLEGQNLSFEELVSEKQNLDFSILNSQLTERAEIKDVDTDIYKTLRLYSDAEGFNNAAAILADSNTFAGTDIVRFGVDINEILDRKRIIGISALAQLVQSLEFYRRYYQYEKIEGMNRSLNIRIPEEAFREALANALVHRLWDSRANIQISMDFNGIEITSPGGLPSGISYDEYIEGRVSLLRNPILSNVFYRLNYIEMFGTGTERIRQAYKDSHAAPTFSVSENTISVFLPVIDTQQEYNESEQAILACLKTGRVLSRRDIQNRTNLSQAKTGRLLNKLIAKGLIRKTGSGKNTRYMSASFN